MTTSLVTASWRAVAQPTLLVPIGLAALMTAATLVFLGPEHAERMRIGVAAVLACALAATAEDPADEIAAASPYPRWMRCATRLSIGAALALPIAVVAVTLFDPGNSRTGDAAVQMLAMLLAGPAIGFGMWKWGNLAQPAYAALVGVACWSLASWSIPAAWSIVGIQPWGPPQEAALIRWSALILLSLAVALATWRDPSDG